MTDTPSLFDPPILSEPGVALDGARHARAGDTERAAALAVMPRSGTQRRKVLEVIAGSTGLTDFDVQAALRMNPSTERPRRVELVEGGWLKDSGRRRNSPYGQPAIVWELTETGRARWLARDD